MLGRCLVFLDFIGDHELVGHDHDNENNEKKQDFHPRFQIEIREIFRKSRDQWISNVYRPADPNVHLFRE